jgi:hypothetical protein
MLAGGWRNTVWGQWQDTLLADNIFQLRTEVYYLATSVPL